MLLEEAYIALSARLATTCIDFKLVPWAGPPICCGTRSSQPCCTHVVPEKGNVASTTDIGA
eukprot:51383-Amphidinium_carterae.1